MAVVEVTPVRSRSDEVRMPRRTPLTWVRSGGLATFVFLLPLLFVFGAFSWYPIVRTVVMSVQHTNLVQPPTWVGLANFSAVIHDPLLPIALKNTLKFAALALVFGYPLPLIAAVLMSEVRKRRGLYAVLAYLPVVIPPVVAVLLWKTFYDAGSTGVFNTVLGWAHLGPYPWLQSQSTALPSLVLESTWANAGGTVIIYLAALTIVNPELYEAAAVDGANAVHRFLHVTLPSLRNIVIIVVLLSTIWTFNDFQIVYILTKGGPGGTTMVMPVLTYETAFGAQRLGEAIAVALYLLPVLAVTIMVLARYMRRGRKR